MRVLKNDFPKAWRGFTKFIREFPLDAKGRVATNLIRLSKDYFYYNDGDLYDSHKVYSNLKDGEIALFIPDGYIDRKGKLWKTGYTNLVYEIGFNPLTKRPIVTPTNPNSEINAVDYAFVKHNDELNKMVEEHNGKIFLKHNM